MKSASANSDEVLEALEALRRELTRLGARVALLENGAVGKPVAPIPAAAVAAADAGISEEILLVISAAIAAFLGKKPHIRQIRLVGANTWAQQGRATIQASHALLGRHGRDAG
jgi:methylmalonyl-CoA carboxyltransferase large subunit